jgi:hypothetical protein
MQELSENEKQEMLDKFGERVIEHVRDVSLKIAMDIANGNTVNPIKREQYNAFSSLSAEEKDKICDLLSETITDTIYNFLDMFEAYSDEMKMSINYGDTEYDLSTISEKMGGEIAFSDEDGWIHKFSKIGRLIN